MELENAGAEFERSLELSPGAADAHIHYASFLISMQRSDEALVHLRTGKTLDPISQSTNLQIGWLLTTARRYDEAIQQFRKLLDMYPDFMPAHGELARALYHKGLRKEADAELLRYDELDEDTEDHKIAFPPELCRVWDRRPASGTFGYVGESAQPKSASFGSTVCTARRERSCVRIPALRLSET